MEFKIEENKTNNMPILRTIKDAHEEVLAKDSKSCLTLYRLRILVKTNQVRSIRCGRKILVDMNDLFRFLGGEKDDQ